MKTTTYWSILLVVLLSAAPVSATVIGGSVLRSPVQFQSASFLISLVGSQQEAHPFHTIPGEGWILESLEVPLYHYESTVGDSAVFSIYSDVSGLPGSELATFSVSGITAEEIIYNITPSFSTGPLQGDTTYWLVGSNPGSGQVNWNMDSAIGSFDLAYRNGDDWVLQSDLCNISAFAIHGTVVPEPSGLILLGMGIAGLMVLVRRTSQTHGK